MAQHVLVDTSRDTVGTGAATDRQLQLQVACGVLHVVPVAHSAVGLRSPVLVLPVATLAGAIGGGDVLLGRVDRAREGVHDDLLELPQAGHFGVDEALESGADMALDAEDVGVTGVLVGDVLRDHRHVAELAAEGDRFHIVVGAPREQRRPEGQHAADGKGQQHSPAAHLPQAVAPLAPDHDGLAQPAPTPGVEQQISDQQSQTGADEGGHEHVGQHAATDAGVTGSQVVSQTGTRCQASQHRHRGAEEEQRALVGRVGSRVHGQASASGYGLAGVGSLAGAGGCWFE